MSADDGPYEERNARNGDEECLDCKEMADLVDRKPDGWEGTKPEDEEADKVAGVGPRAGWQMIWYIIVRRPDRANDESDTFSFRLC